MLQPTFFDVTTGRGNKGRYTCCHHFITAVIETRTLLNQNILDTIEEITYNNRPHCVAIVSSLLPSNAPGSNREDTLLHREPFCGNIGDHI